MRGPLGREIPRLRGPSAPRSRPCGVAVCCAFVRTARNPVCGGSLPYQEPPMDVCIENVFPAVAMPFNPFQREPREDKRPGDKKRGGRSRGEKNHKTGASASSASGDTLRVNGDALFASVRAETDEP